MGTDTVNPPTQPQTAGGGTPVKDLAERVVKLGIYLSGYEEHSALAEAYLTVSAQLRVARAALSEDICAYSAHKKALAEIDALEKEAK